MNYQMLEGKKRMMSKRPLFALQFSLCVTLSVISKPVSQKCAYTKFSIYCTDYSFIEGYSDLILQFIFLERKEKRTHKTMLQATISIEYMKKFLADLGRVFPEKKSFLGF